MGLAGVGGATVGDVRGGEHLGDLGGDGLLGSS